MAKKAIGNKRATKLLDLRLQGVEIGITQAVAINNVTATEIDLEGKAALIKNIDTNPVYILQATDSTVGWPLLEGETFPDYVTGVFYAKSEGATGTLYVQEVDPEVTGI